MAEKHAVTRRAVMLAGAGLAQGSRAFGESALTAGQVIERIKQNIGVAWRSETVDNIIAGSADTRVTGIATTMMATLDVIERAAASGKNMVITHEPTFYTHQDKTDWLEQDRTYLFKAAFIKKHDVVVFRLHDHWHARKPDGIAMGMARELGWEKFAEPDHPRSFRFQGVTLLKLAREMESKLKIRTMRVVGHPDLVVNRVMANWGYASQIPSIPTLARNDVDVLVVGEAREWELVEYAQDAISAGQKKGLIVLGHVVSEQAGMKLCAEWLRSIIHEAPVEFVGAVEPFWSPGKPVT